mgnify:CR=1 FL=1
MRVLFIADHYSDEMLVGGGENNDAALIEYIRQNGVDLTCIKSESVTIELVKDYDKIIVGNFCFLHNDVMEYMQENKQYLIYEHDHKYTITRDPSKFVGFKIPEDKFINVEFYKNSSSTVVLSKICKEVLKKNIPETNVHSIGCSLWTDGFFDSLQALREIEKTKETCILLSFNPTKNYPKTVEYCKKKDIKADAIGAANHMEFLELMAKYKKFLFMPSVLETFSRVCAEAKMLNLQVMTNKKLVGLFSEDCSSLSGKELQEELYTRGQSAKKYFLEWILA